MSFGDSMHLYNQLWIRLCVKPHYPIGKDEKSFLKYTNSAIIFQINWKDEATTTFHNKPGNQQPNVTAKRKTGGGDTKSSSLTLVRGARLQQNPTALSTSLNIAELSATFFLHHFSSLLSGSCPIALPCWTRSWALPHHQDKAGVVTPQGVRLLQPYPQDLHSP